MKTRVDSRFRSEAAQFAFRFACDDCVHFDARRAACSLGFAAAPRRDALAEESFESCKTFELG
jgi:hypothetical protein